MCSNNQNVEKCKLCRELGIHCCSGHPLFKEEELAKVHYHVDMVSLIKRPVKVTYDDVLDGYYIVPKENKNTKKIDISKEDCMFYDKENMKCLIEEYKPDVCKNFGNETNPCYFTFKTLEEIKSMEFTEVSKKAIKAINLGEKIRDYETNTILNFKLPKIKKFNKKHLKDMKEDMLIYLIINYINLFTEDNEYFTVYNEYKLLQTPDGAMAALKLNQIKVKIPELKAVEEAFNKANRIMLYKDRLYLDILVNKLGKLLDGISYKPFTKGIEKNLERIALPILLLDVYKDEYKNKKYKGLTDTNKIIKAKQWLNKQFGSDSLIYADENFRINMENIHRIYKTIMKQK